MNPRFCRSSGLPKPTAGCDCPRCLEELAVSDLEREQLARLERLPGTVHSIADDAPWTWRAWNGALATKRASGEP